jgi:hypothetical protein
MHKTLIAPLTLLVAVAGVAATAQKSGPSAGETPATPVAVELFTSQGCSSCPPADAILERLEHEANVIVMTRPVTYWDRLGWRDTLAKEANTSLQRAYAARGGEGAGVYTPQAMVMGVRGLVGSEERQLRTMIAQEKRKSGPSVRAVSTADGGRNLAIGEGAAANATVSLVALKSSASVRIGSGENGGRTVRYTNVWQSEREIGRWNGKPATYAISGDIIKSLAGDRRVVIVRAGAAGRIIAARYI